MKHLILISAVCFSMLSKNPDSIKNNTQADTLTTLKFSSKLVTNCSQAECLASLNNLIQNKKSYVLIYKSGNKWIVDRNRQNYPDVLTSYKLSHISILEGNVKLSGLSFPDSSKVAIIQ